MAEVLGTFIAGIGLFFTGVKMVGNNLKSMTSRRFRQLVSGWTANPYRAGLLGALAGIFTQSSSAVTFITVSLISTGLLTVRAAFTVILWANVGLSSLVLISTLNIQLFILYLLGIAGLSFAFDKPVQHRHAMGALLGISLLFFGLKMMQTGVAPLQQYDWFKNALYQTRNSYALAFAAGAVLTFVAQSSAAVSIVAITMTKSGVFSVEQAMMLIYGTNVGGSLTTWFLSSGLKGASKQLAMFQVLFNIAGGLLFVPLFYLELYASVPLVKAFVGWVSPSVEKQMAYVYLIFNLCVAAGMSFFMQPLHRWFSKRWAAPDEEDKAKPQYIQEHALADAETALDLVEKEQLRLFKRLPDYLENVRREQPSAELERSHAAFASVSSEVQSFLKELFQQNPTGKTSERMLNVQDRNSIVTSAEEGIFQLSTTMCSSNHSPKLKNLIHNFVEGLDAILLTSLDALEGKDPQDVELLMQITADRGDLMERVRNTYLASEGGLELQEKSLLLYVTNLFERIVWMLRRIGMLLQAK